MREIYRGQGIGIETKIPKRSEWEETVDTIQLSKKFNWTEINGILICQMQT